MPSGIRDIGSGSDFPAGLLIGSLGGDNAVPGRRRIERHKIPIRNTENPVTRRSVDLST